MSQLTLLMDDHLWHCVPECCCHSSWGWVLLCPFVPSCLCHLCGEIWSDVCPKDLLSWMWCFYLLLRVILKRSRTGYSRKQRAMKLARLARIMTCVWNGNLHRQSWQKQQAQSKAVPSSGSLDRKSKIQGMQWAHTVCCQTKDWTSYSIPNRLRDYTWRTIAT